MAKKIRKGTPKLKRDEFQRRRGPPQLLAIHCSSCGKKVATYQKDGPGSLKRMYLDRIFEPKDLANLQTSARKPSDYGPLLCPDCKAQLGSPSVYEPEKRLAFTMIPGKVKPKKQK